MNNSILAILANFWRVDNKHGLYPQRDVFNFQVKYSGVIYFIITCVMLCMGIFFAIGGI